VTAATSTTAPPEPAPVVDGDVTTAVVGGVQVVVKRVPGAEFSAGKLFVRGGTRNWSAANAGIEQLAFGVAASGGTRSLDKTALTRKLASLGANVDGESRNDFSLIAVKAPVGAWDAAFAVLVDAFRNPALPASEIELQRTQLLSQLHREQEDPDGQVWTLERKQIFANHPYANRHLGTLDSVAAIKPADLGPYLDRLRETSRLLFTFAGDVDAAHVIDQVKAAFGDLPRGSYVETPIPALAFDKAQLVTQARKLPTNYVESVFLSPQWSDPDWVTALVAVHGLSWRLWQELRTKRNLTYSVNASIDGAFVRPFGVLYVTAVDPNAAMKVMLDEVRRLQTEPVGDEELAGFKATLLTDYLESHETTEGQARALGEAQLYGGDWHLARTLPDRMRLVSARDVQEFARRYFTRLQAAVVGDPAKVDRALFTSL
jgi:predicted Zn-dependent peptidase